MKNQIAIVCSIVVGYVVFIGIIFTLWSMDVVPEAQFFSFFFHYSTPPKLLGIPLKSKSQFYGLGVWFFLNSFSTIWSTAVINPIFSSIMITKDNEQDLYKSSTLVTIMTVYEILKSVRNFVSLLGVLSNAYWFTMTSGGWLIGALLTRYLYLNENTKCWMKHNYETPDCREERSSTSINASVLSSLHRRTVKY